MESSTTRTMLGPSIYAKSPVVILALDDAEKANSPLSHAAGFDELVALLPGLRQQEGSCGAPQCFASVDAAIHPAFPHLLEHVSIELQNLAGAQLCCVRTHGPHLAEQNEVVVPYEDADVCFDALELAMALLSPDGHEGGAPFDFAQRCDGFLDRASRTMLPVQDRALVRTARALDIPDVRVVGRIVQLGQGRHQQRVSATKTTLTNTVGNDLAANKDYSRRLLGDLGLPVPRCERIYRKRDLAAAAKRIGYPVVVKPNNGSMGGGVSVGMKNRQEALDAYTRAREYGRSVLIEEVVEGGDFRMLVIDGKLCAASQRVPGHVVGDGELSVEELVAQVNSDPRRGTGPTHSWTRIEIDQQAERLLTELDYTRESIPKAGERVFLRRNANTSDGGTAIDVTDQVHPDNRDIAVRAARAIGLDIAGVDFLTSDISTSMWKNGGRICEINSRPGLRKHMWPAEGRPRDVMTPIIDMLFPAGRPSRIPIIAVTGTGDTKKTAQMIEHILSANGLHVGLLLNRRVYSAGRTTSARKLKPADAMRMIFLDPEVDVAVLELPPKDVLRHGLGCDVIDVTAVVNDDTDDEAALLGTGNANAIDAIGLVARLTRNVVYVDEEDKNASAIEYAGDGSQICRVHRDRTRPPATGTRDARGRHASLDGQSVSIYDGARLEVKVPIAEALDTAPSTDADSKADAERASKMFASVCAYGVGIDPKDIFRSLSNFGEAARRSKPKRARKKKAS